MKGFLNCNGVLAWLSEESEYMSNMEKVTFETIVLLIFLKVSICLGVVLGCSSACAVRRIVGTCFSWWQWQLLTPAAGDVKSLGVSIHGMCLPAWTWLLVAVVNSKSNQGTWNTVNFSILEWTVPHRACSKYPMAFCLRKKTNCHETRGF